MENGTDLQDAARSDADLNCKTLVNRALHDGIPSSVNKRTKRHVMRSLGVRQFDAKVVFGECVA
jgi:hypothetical protein